MAITLYDVSVPVFLRGFERLSAILDKGRAFAEAGGIAPETLLGARLAPDMLTLAGQVQRASDTAKFAMVRVAGVENEGFADEEKSFADLADRIARTVAFLGRVPRSALDGREDTVIEARIGRATVQVTGADYVLKFALPNFLFHVTTAYDILRHEGVTLGKGDYIGPLG
ncbi:MAG: DUF1993 domain-containing protein [Amaricoccus sp.]